MNQLSSPKMNHVRGRGSIRDYRFNEGCRSIKYHFNGDHRPNDNYGSFQEIKRLNG